MVLPASVIDNNTNVDAPGQRGGSHPLHVLLHLRQTGGQVHLFVYGTPAADAACAAGSVNR